MARVKLKFKDNEYLTSIESTETRDRVALCYRHVHDSNAYVKGRFMVNTKYKS